jgi:hypothetical protein
MGCIIIFSFPFLFRPYRAVIILAFTGTGRCPVLFYVALSGQKNLILYPESCIYAMRHVLCAMQVQPLAFKL